MRDYRAYILDIDGHRFILAKDFAIDHPNDAAALSAAKRLTDAHDVEVWDGSRLVARFTPSEETSSGFPPLAPAVPSAHREKATAGQADSASRVLELVECILQEKASTKVIE